MVRGYLATWLSREATCSRNLYLALSISLLPTHLGPVTLSFSAIILSTEEIRWDNILASFGINSLYSYGRFLWQEQDLNKHSCIQATGMQNVALSSFTKTNPTFHPVKAQFSFGLWGRPNFLASALLFPSTLYVPPKRADALLFSKNSVYFLNSVVLLRHFFFFHQETFASPCIQPSPAGPGKDDLLCKVFLFPNSPPSVRMLLALFHKLVQIFVYTFE